ncbi:amino acid transporter AVT6E [Malania oleifera]|uniref:amino acid transporter AVT6E n=1 Tax=Malania oleifera TaxID=397392 RepID=UPI0025AEA691|nr:amino acid transporter AVT6E [Malania oleifera]
MESNYSALPRGSFVELQLHNDNDDLSSLNNFAPTNPRCSPEKAHIKMLPVDIEGCLDSKNGRDLDDSDGDFDIDNYPLIASGINKDSGMYGAVFNLTTTIIGAGIMALPATMKVLGLVLGFVLIILMGILSEISVELLIRFSVFCKASSYGEVVQYALGRPARVLSEICIIVNNAGILVVYLIIMGDVMSGSSHHIGVFDQWLGTGVWDHRKLVILVIVVVFLAPLCSLEKIDSLSMTSAASVALAVVFVLVACIIAFIKLVEGRIETPRMAPDFGSKRAILDLLVVIPIMTNAYICHFNVQPIYNELEGRSPQKMSRVGRITTVLCIVVYTFTAISGYLLFGKDTESDVLTNFDKDLGIRFSSALNYIVRVGYIFHLVLVFPVVHFSLRQTVDALVFEGSAPLSESRKRCLVLTVVLLGLVYFGSTMIPNIWTAFKFTGATTAVSLGFIFPSLIALRLRKQGAVLSFGEKLLSWLMLILATIVSIVGVIGNIYSIKGQTE